MSKIPTRVQRRRQKGSKLPPNTLCCTRPGPWSTPLVGSKHEAARWFRLWLCDSPDYTALEIVEYVAEVCGCDVQLHKSADPNQTARHYLATLDVLLQYDYLGCWCRENDECHVDTYIELLTNRTAATVEHEPGEA